MPTIDSCSEQCQQMTDVHSNVNTWQLFRAMPTLDSCSEQCQQMTAVQSNVNTWQLLRAVPTLDSCSEQYQLLTAVQRNFNTWQLFSTYRNKWVEQNISLLPNCCSKHKLVHQFRRCLSSCIMPPPVHTFLSGTFICVRKNVFKRITFCEHCCCCHCNWTLKGNYKT